MALPDQLAEVAGVIAEQFGELCPVTMTYLGEGYDSTAFDVNGRWVFRFPKRSDVERQLFLEAAILPQIAPRTPVPIPSFAFHGVPSRRFPRHFVGYPRLAGVPGIGLDPAHIRFDRLARVLGAFLTSLHSFPVQTAKQAGAPEYAPEALLEEVRAEALGDLHMIGPVATGIAEDGLRSLLEAGVDLRDLHVTPVVVHGDLGAEHVLLDPETQEVTGIIDWSEVGVSDPAIDFAGMYHWGGAELTQAVLAHYHGEADEGLLGRARFFAAARGIGDIVFSLRKQRPEYLDSGIRALRWCLSGPLPGAVY